MNLKKKESSNKYFFFVSLLFALIILVIYVYEKEPYQISMKRPIYTFLNSFWGYKFFNKHYTFYFSDILILSLTGLCLVKKGFKGMLSTESSKYFLFFIFSMVLSLLCSSFWLRGFQFFMIFNFFTTFLFFACLISFTEQQDFRKFLQILFISLLIVSLYQGFVGVYQYFMQKSLGLKRWHEPKFSVTNKDLSSISLENGYRWIFDHILHLKRNTPRLLRATGTMAHANTFGPFMLFSTLATFGLYFLSSKRRFDLFFCLCLFFQVLAIFISLSRAAILGFFILITTFSLFCFFKFRKTDVYKKKIKKSLVVAFLCFFICSILFYNQLHHRLGSQPYTKVSKYLDKGRINSNKIAWEMIKQKPLLGVGSHNFYYHYKLFVPEDLKNQNLKLNFPHNIYILILLEEGVLGLLIFLFFILSIYKTFLKKEITLFSCLFLAYFFTMLCLGLIDFGLVYKIQGKMLLFLPAGLLIAESLYKDRLLINDC